MDDITRQKIEAMVGIAATNESGLQYGISEAFPSWNVHYEYYQGHIELHLEPSSPSALVRSFADYLNGKLTSVPEVETVGRNFCYFAARLKSERIKEDDYERIGREIIKFRDILTPFIEGCLSSLSAASEVAEALGKYYEQLKQWEPYHINVIDELHANENAHSRILLRLLKYPQAGQLVILKSFLETKVHGWSDLNPEVGHPTIIYNSEYIDGLVEAKGEYAVIIENKIHNAEDQDRQIERYVDTVISHGTPADRIWVVYLTRDGGKVISDYSYTDRVKIILGDRFIPLNYRDDILPWLKESVLPSCMIREEWLVSALKQYIDHLEGMFGLRETQRKIQNKMEERILRLANLTEDTDLPTIYDSLREQEKQFSAILDIIANKKNKIDRAVLRSFTKISKAYFEDSCPERHFDLEDHSRDGFYQIFPEGWPRNVHLEWIPFRGKHLITGHNLTLVLHIEPPKNAKVNQLIAGLAKDETFKALNRENNFRQSGSTFYSFTKSLARSFNEMSIADKTALLKDIYDKVCAVIPIVDKYLSEGKPQPSVEEDEE